MLQRAGRGLYPPSPGAGMSPPPAASPYSPVLPPEEAWGVWRLEGHAGACSPAPGSVLPASAQHPGSNAGSAHSRVSPASRAAGTAWVLAASWGCRHGVNTPADDLSWAQSALSGASVPPRAMRGAGGCPPASADERDSVCNCPQGGWQWAGWQPLGHGARLCPLG